MLQGSSVSKATIAKAVGKDGRIKSQKLKTPKEESAPTGVGGSYTTDADGVRRLVKKGTTGG